MLCVLYFCIVDGWNSVLGIVLWMNCGLLEEILDKIYIFFKQNTHLQVATVARYLKAAVMTIRRVSLNKRKSVFHSEEHQFSEA